MNIIAELTSAAEEVHNHLGAGHTESTYHRSLERELSERGVSFSSEGTVPIFYKGSPVGRRRPDMFVYCDEGTVIVELKAGSTSGEEQLLDYVRLLEDDENYDVIEGVVIRFNEDVEIA